MREWEELVATALLGTQRRTLDAKVLPASVRSLVEESGSAEGTLLSAAALLTGYRRAGQLPERGAVPVPVSEEDTRELLGRAARRRLAVLLGGDRLYLLGEWLNAVAERGLRVPPERLPALADAARGRSELRPLVAAAAGPRGAWLAAFRAEWAFLADAPSDEPDVWQFGTPAQRESWLRDLRISDPVEALAALGGVWSTEPAALRAQFLGVLRTRLSTSDEAFLESALDDRAQDVRRLAAELLAALPGSALSQRMAARLRPLVSITRRALTVNLPTACDDAMRRDGITASPPGGAGKRTWWFGQLVSAAPLTLWAELADPDRLVHLPVDGVDPRVLWLGLAAATVRERDADWARALLDAETPLALDQLAALIAVLPREKWAAAVARLSRDKLPTGLYLALPRPWPVDLGTQVLDRLAAARDDRATAHVADIAARAVPPECLDHPLAVAPLDDEASPWRRRLVDTLIFRRAMHAELSG